MDYQNRVGSKKGSGGVAGTSETNQYRRERLKNLLQSKINIDTDPYVFKNHLGILECKLCFTTHMSESNYITHTTARRHQLNLMRRADLEKRQKQSKEDKGIEEVIQKRYWKKIGKPLYKVNKIRDPINLQKGLLFTLKFDHIKDDVQPLYKFLPSNKTQKEEPDSKYQHLVISAEPYDNIGFKIPNEKIDTSGNSLWNYWDPDTKEYCLQFFYLSK